MNSETPGFPMVQDVFGYARHSESCVANEGVLTRVVKVQEAFGEGEPATDVNHRVGTIEEQSSRDWLKTEMLSVLDKVIEEAGTLRELVRESSRGSWKPQTLEALESAMERVVFLWGNASLPVRKPTISPVAGVPTKKRRYGAGSGIDSNMQRPRLPTLLPSPDTSTFAV